MALTNAQYYSIMRQYERTRLKNHDIQTARYEEVCKKIPEFRSIDESISVMSVQYGKRLLDGDPGALDSLKEELEILRSSKQNLLVSAGFPADYLEPVYTCPDCKDTGYIGNQKCHCFRKSVIHLLYDQSNMKEFPTDATFGNFKLDFYSNSQYDKTTGRSARAMMEDTLKICRKFIDNFGHDFQNLFFYGNVGVGKTFLSTCIAREIMEREYSVIYFSAPQLFNILTQNKFEKDNSNARNMADYIYNCDLLIIDDLGSEYTSAFIAAQFFTCLNERLIHRKSTIISTNLSLDSIADLYTERAFSRITSNYALLKIIGDDIRIRKKLKQREEH